MIITVAVNKRTEILGTVSQSMCTIFEQEKLLSSYMLILRALFILLVSEGQMAISNVKLVRSEILNTHNQPEKTLLHLQAVQLYQQLMFSFIAQQKRCFD